MKEKGFKFLTNFTLEREEVFRKAAEIHGIKYSFENETYSFQGNKLGDDGTWMKAFYVEDVYRDLGDYWRTVDDLKVKIK